MRANRTKSFRLLTGLMCAFVGLSATLGYSVNAQSTLQSDADVTITPGVLTIESVPSINFYIDMENYKSRPPALVVAQGEVTGSFVMTDARMSGRSWTLKLAMDSFKNPKTGVTALGTEVFFQGLQSGPQTSTGNSFTGYDITLFPGSKETVTYAVSNPGAATVAVWEGVIPQAQIDVAAKYAEMGPFFSTMYWSIEDTP